MLVLGKFFQHGKILMNSSYHTETLHHSRVFN